MIKPHCILVSTRRPELLKEFSDTGVITCFNNGKVNDGGLPWDILYWGPNVLSLKLSSIEPRWQDEV